MTSITKELREYTETFSDMGQEDYEKVLAIADRIDAELTEQYIALPLDMDGKPIHFGDVMQMDGDSELREVVGFYEEGFLAWLNGRFVPCAASLYRHATPDTWESIIEDARTCTGSTGNYTSVPTMRWTNEMDTLVARCKALADSKVKVQALEDEIRELSFHEDMGR